MKVSLNSIRFLNQFNKSAGDPTADGVDKLADKIGAQLGAIEEIVDFGSRYEPVIIVKVVSCVDHPDADRLHLCKVDDGGQAQNVGRDADGYIQVVCGAPNVREGMLAAWLPPGSIVPSTIDKEPFVLEAREIRGQTSNGMMASPKELGIGDAHEGILEVDTDAAPGTSFAAAYHLTGDVVMDIENKMFTHRPDCFGLIGVARELAGIQGQAYTSPDWFKPKPALPATENDSLRFEVRNELPELVPRFSAVTMRDVKLGPSPVWLQLELAKVGLRPINNIVDLTNFIMLVTGQPLHAYDYDKVKALSGGNGAVIVVRNPKPGEKITLLNGKTIEPRAEAIMIATDKQLIGVGGVMGGGDTEVDDHTKNIILECANFDMYSIRRTSMAHGLFTDAVSRFNKGQSPLQNLAVLGKIVGDVLRIAGGAVAGPVIDDNHLPAETLDRESVHPPVTVSAEFVNSRLGLKLATDQMKHLLTNVEFKVDVNGDDLTVAAPFWRTDIELREDVVEEIGRLYGYDKLPLELPARDLTPAPKDRLFELKANLRQQLSTAGANEVLTYSFVHGNLFDRVGQDRGLAFQIGNAISPDLQFYRLSLTPSLLEKVHPNVKSGYGEFGLFELGKVHAKTEVDEDGLPREFERLAAVFAADDKLAKANYAGAAYYQARKYADNLLRHFNLQDEVSYIALEKADFGGHELSQQMVQPYEPARSAALVKADRIVGVVGEFRADVRRALKLPEYCAGFELFLSVFNQSDAVYTALSRFPKVEQDICFKVTAAMPYDQLFEFVRQQAAAGKPANSLLVIEPLDIFQRQDEAGYKQITFRLSLASYDRTLTDKEMSAVLGAVADAAKAELDAERI